MNATEAVDKIKQNKTITGIVVVVIVAVVVYYFRDKIFGTPTTESEDYMITSATKGIGTKSSPSSNNKATNASNTNLVDEYAVLKKGSSGIEVKALQEHVNKYRNQLEENWRKMLNYQGPTTPEFEAKHPTLVADGRFGSKTEAALHFYTKRKSITLAQVRKLLVV